MFHRDLVVTKTLSIRIEKVDISIEKVRRLVHVLHFIVLDKFGGCPSSIKGTSGDYGSLNEVSNGLVFVKWVPTFRGGPY